MNQIFPATAAFLADDCIWPEGNALIRRLSALGKEGRVPPFLPELARLEWSGWKLLQASPLLPDAVATPCVNPTLELVRTGWSGLAELASGRPVEPIRQECYVALYRTAGHPGVRMSELSGHDLLAMKMVAENLDRREVAREGGISVRLIDTMLMRAEGKGLILLPLSSLIHPWSGARVEVFTLQWHLTQSCDLHCRHCYDRSNRREMTLSEALAVLDQFYHFCELHHVAGQVTFTGGNPVLYPHFKALYEETVRCGFQVAILGNPVSREWLQEMVRIAPPEYYQVSLEGLEPHNDYIRGKGHFGKTMKFLDLLGEMGIYRMVMLTLTREHADQVLELADLLAGKVEKFNFNRLASVGEGAALAALSPYDFESFLERYLKKAREHAWLGCKDNLFNILQAREGLKLTGGCTGFGCGAAFNFVSLLADGQVHACRKFPSLIGNIDRSSLAEIYDGDIARRYRLGSMGCRDCQLRGVCGGCPAAAYGMVEDIFTAVDPYCFIHHSNR